MALDDAVLSEVEEARQRLEHLEASVYEARNAFHHSIRRLHAAGGSMREIATALGMSHQRVHQIIGEDAIIEIQATARDVVTLPISVATDDHTAPAAGSPAGAGDERPAAVPAVARGRTPVAPDRGTAGGPPVDRCAFCGAARTEAVRLLGTPGRRFICGACVVTARSDLAVTSPRTCSYCGRTSTSTTSTSDRTTTICEACVASCERLLGSHERPRRTIGRLNPRIRCSFCNASSTEAKKLVGGPGVYICGECAPAAMTVADRGAPVRGPRSVTLQPASREAHGCAFCRKVPLQVKAMVKGGRGRICNECLELCLTMLAEEPD
ncbi:MAG TPA: ClpX C4-type zinc finger protein [Acidimicrobiales bacterium]|nr:ClpX C4-type zinc finger protein [Acidimicrobiales bacterium]